MARSSRPPPEEDEDEQQPSNVLQFNDPLSWKAGKPIPTGTLINRLKALSKELIALEQEAVDRDSLATPAKELVSVGLLQHKDGGVKAYAACCLADMLRLHAPDAPYTAVQLKDIFELFVRQLRGLSDPETPYYQQHLYLLESLASVKSVVLISDIPNGESITLKIFTSFFDLARPDGPKNVEYQMTDILIQLIEECNSLPSEVVDIIVAQFFRANPSALANISSRGKPNTKEVKGGVAVGGGGAGGGAGGVGVGGKGKDDGQLKLVSAIPPPAYTMAKAICNACIDKMARQICQYFSEVILDASPSSRPRKGRHTSMSPDSDSDDPELHEPSHEDLQELHKAHLLVKELWKACPAVLQNVIPQLEQELLAENAELRVLSTETIGDMALTGAFGGSAPATWKAWIGRANDKSSAVRAKWVEAAVRIIKERNDFMAVQLVDLVAGKLNDLDDRVRLSACVSLGELDYASITTKLGADLSPFNTYDPGMGSGAPARKAKGADENTKNWGKKILHNLGERVRDKKFSVRWEGMFCLARIWNMAYADIAAGNELITAQLGWIPSKILDTFYINDAEVNVLLDHVLFVVLLPVNYPPIEKERTVENGKNGRGREKEAEKEREKEIAEGDKIRVQRLLVLVKGLDVKAKKALFAVPLRQISYAKVMDVFLKSCEDYNGGVFDNGVDEEGVKHALNKFIEWLSQKLPDSPKAKENLMKFAKLHDRRCYQLIRFCFSPDSDYRTVVKALKEIKKRISEAPGTAPVIMETLTPLLYRVSQLIYNKSHVPHIVEFSRTDEAVLGGVAHEVLKEMSSSNPAVFKANVKALSDLLQEQSSTTRHGAADSGAVDTLKACAGFAKSYPMDMPQERKLLQALVSFALTGKPPAAAKHAVSILMYSAKRKDMYAADLIKRCVKDFSFGEEHFLAKLACLAQLVLLAPEQCEEENDSIMDIARDVLLNVRTPATEEDKANEAAVWVDDDVLDDECKAKLLAVRILVNRLRAQTEKLKGLDDQESIKKTVPKAVIKMLMQLIMKEGELSKDGDTPRAHKSRLRLSAALSLLKLASHKVYDDLIGSVEFNHLACVVQDHCTEVRAGFVNKVKKYLASSRLGNRFYTIIFLMAYEPQQDMREAAVTWVKARTASMRKTNSGGIVMEAVFSRLLSLLAHHPDFGTQVDDLADFAKYILFYLTAVANEDNLSLVYHVAQRVKQFRDGLSPDNSENLYYLSELAQAVIRRYADYHHWPIQTWPGKIGLPAALFMSMQSAEQSLQVSRKTYLPEQIEVRLDGLIKPKGGRQGKKRKSDPSAGTRVATPAKKKYKASSTTPGGGETPATEKRKPGRPPKTPKTKKDDMDVGGTERRRSGRATTKVKYVESGPSDDEEESAGSAGDDSDEDVEMEDAGSEGGDEEEEEEEEEKEEEKEEERKEKGSVRRGRKPREKVVEKESSPVPTPTRKRKGAVDAMDEDEDDQEAAAPEPEKEPSPEPEAEAEEPEKHSPPPKITPMKRGRGRPKRVVAPSSPELPAPAPTKEKTPEKKPTRGSRRTRGTAAAAAVNGSTNGNSKSKAIATGDDDSSELSEPPSDVEA